MTNINDTDHDLATMIAQTLTDLECEAIDGGIYNDGGCIPFPFPRPSDEDPIFAPFGL
ncbi:MAG: hypothetical protein IPQ07_26080 [Myxococcales bacterium]|nr:hypothetical protein [Myxococcales bacterium]